MHAIFPYELCGQGRSRRGALLKVIDADGCIGFSDIHPWPERGDLPLFQQIALLKEGRWTSLTRQSVVAAQRDAIARKQGVSLFVQKHIDNHYTIVETHERLSSTIEWALSYGFRVAKLKITPLSLPSLFVLKDDLLLFDRLRFDGNGTLSLENLYDLADVFGEKIEFVEDPFPFDKKVWEEGVRSLPFVFAADCHVVDAIGYSEAARYLIIKPAVDDLSLMDRIPFEQTVIFTSYLDHPVGQLHAAATAVEKGCSFPCGLATHLAYDATEWSRALRMDGSLLLLPQGKGIGFDNLFNELEWIDL